MWAHIVSEPETFTNERDSWLVYLVRVGFYFYFYFFVLYFYLCLLTDCEKKKPKFAHSSIKYKFYDVHIYSDNNKWNNVSCEST